MVSEQLQERRVFFFKILSLKPISGNNHSLRKGDKMVAFMKQY